MGRTYGVLHRYNAWEAGELLEGTFHSFGGRHSSRAAAARQCKRQLERWGVTVPKRVKTLTLEKMS
jgi:hypothetical protein